jgi:hypothetical protein
MWVVVNASAWQVPPTEVVGPDKIMDPNWWFLQQTKSYRMSNCCISMAFGDHHVSDTGGTSMMTNHVPTNPNEQLKKIEEDKMVSLFVKLHSILITLVYNQAFEKLSTSILMTPQDLLDLAREETSLLCKCIAALGTGTVTMQEKAGECGLCESNLMALFIATEMI